MLTIENVNDISPEEANKNVKKGVIHDTNLLKEGRNDPIRTEPIKKKNDADLKVDRDHITARRSVFSERTKTLKKFQSEAQYFAPDYVQGSVLVGERPAEIGFSGKFLVQKCGIFSSKVVVLPEDTREPNIKQLTVDVADPLDDPEKKKKKVAKPKANVPLQKAKLNARLVSVYSRLKKASASTQTGFLLAFQVNENYGETIRYLEFGDFFKNERVTLSTDSDRFKIFPIILAKVVKAEAEEKSFLKSPNSKKRSREKKSGPPKRELFVTVKPASQPDTNPDILANPNIIACSEVALTPTLPAPQGEVPVMACNPFPAVPSAEFGSAETESMPSITTTNSQESSNSDQHPIMTFSASVSLQLLPTSVMSSQVQGSPFAHIDFPANVYGTCNTTAVTVVTTGPHTSPITSTTVSGTKSVGTPTTTKLSGATTTGISNSLTSKVSGTQTTAMSGTPTTVVSGTSTTVLSGTPTTVVSDTPTSTESGVPTTTVSGTSTTKVSGTLTTSVSCTGKPTTTVSVLPITTVSGAPNYPAAGAQTTTVSANSTSTAVITGLGRNPANTMSPTPITSGESGRHTSTGVSETLFTTGGSGESATLTSTLSGSPAIDIVSGIPDTPEVLERPAIMITTVSRTPVKAKVSGRPAMIITTLSRKEGATANPAVSRKVIPTPIKLSGEVPTAQNKVSRWLSKHAQTLPLMIMSRKSPTVSTEELVPPKFTANYDQHPTANTEVSESQHPAIPISDSAASSLLNTTITVSGDQTVPKPKESTFSIFQSDSEEELKTPEKDSKKTNAKAKPAPKKLSNVTKRNLVTPETRSVKPKVPNFYTKVDGFRTAKTRSRVKGGQRKAALFGSSVSHKIKKSISKPENADAFMSTDESDEENEPVVKKKMKPMRTSKYFDEAQIEEML